MRNLRSVTLLALVAVSACSGDASESTDAAMSAVGPSESTGDPWCATARAVREAGSALDVIDASAPAQVEAAVGQLVDRLDAAEAVAPVQIAGAVAVTAASARELQALLSAVGYEIVRVDLSSVLGPENEAASRSIDDYNVEVCGFAPSSSTEASAEAGGDGGDGGDGGVVFDPADGPIRDQAIGLLVDEGFTPDQAACLFDALDLADAAALSDPAAEAELLDRCDIDPAQLPEADG